MENPLKQIQQQSYETRSRIFWIVVAGMAVVLVILIVQSIKNTIGNVGGNLVQIEAAKYVPESTTTYVRVEGVTQNSQTLQVYFNINNSGTDILNVSKLSQITFTFGSNVIHPSKITDRQGNPYAQKILSHTQNFGILVFPGIGNQKGSLLFDQMFLETAPSDLFQQKIWFDINQQSNPTQVRN